jgi:hypothetical protein
MHVTKDVYVQFLPTLGAIQLLFIVLGLDEYIAHCVDIRLDLLDVPSMSRTVMWITDAPI